MKEDSKEMSTDHSSSSNNVQELVTNMNVLICAEAMNSKEESLTEDVGLETISLTNPSNEQTEKNSISEAEGTTEAFHHLIKDIVLDKQIAKTDNAEEKYLAEDQGSEDMIHFLQEPTSRNTDSVENINFNCQEDKGMGDCFQNKSMSNTSLKCSGNESTRRMKDDIGNSYLESETVMLHSEEYIKDYMPTSESETGDDMFVQEISTKDIIVEEEVMSNSLQQFTSKSPNSEQKNIVAHSYLEKSTATDTHLGKVFIDDKLQQYVEGTKESMKPAANTNDCFRNISLSELSQQHTRDNSNDENRSTDVSSFKDTALDNSHEHTLKDITSLSHSEKTQVSSSYSDGATIDICSKGHITKSGLSENNFHYQKNKFSYYNSVRKYPFKDGKCHKVDPTKDKKIWSRCFSRRYSSVPISTSNDCDVASNDPSEKYKEMLKFHLKEYGMVSSNHSDDIMNKPTSECNESQKPFIIRKKKNSALEKQTVIPHLTRGRSHDKKCFTERKISNESLRSCSSTEHSLLGLHCVQPSFRGWNSANFAFRRWSHTHYSSRGYNSAQNSNGGWNDAPYLFRGWTSIQNSFRVRGHTNHLFRGHSTTRHTISGKGFIKQPFDDSVQEDRSPLEYFGDMNKSTSRESITCENISTQKHEVLSDTEKSEDIVYKTNADVKNVAAVQSNIIEETNMLIPKVQEKSHIECVSSVNVQKTLTNFIEIKAVPPWVPFCNLSIILSIIINMYFQSFTKENSVVKDVLNTLQSVIELVEETIKGYQIYCEMNLSSILEKSLNLRSHSSETIQEVNGIILLQRKRVKKIVEESQMELKAIKPYASYSEQEITEVCNKIRRNMKEQIDQVQWLNNDLKFNECFSEISINYSYQKTGELINVLLRDVEMAKKYLKLQMENEYQINSSDETSGRVTFNMPLVEKCFVMKQRLEDLQNTALDAEQNVSIPV